MLTLKRFGTLAGSYGGDLQRWPRQLRDEAQALLNVSAAARAIFDDARALDDAIAAASALEGATGRQPDEQAALARLRSGVAARISAPIATRKPGRWPSLAEVFTRLRSMPFPAMGAAVAGAVLAGLLVGAISVSEPAADSVLAALLQPAPIHRLWD